MQTFSILLTSNFLTFGSNVKRHPLRNFAASSKKKKTEEEAGLKVPFRRNFGIRMSRTCVKNTYYILVPGIEYDLYNLEIGATVVRSVKESAQNQS